MEEILKKLRFKDKGIVINAPDTWQREFEKVGFKTSYDNELKSSNTLVFVTSSRECSDFFIKQLKKIVPDSVLWLAYPKGTSKIKTDINRDTIRIAAEQYEITTVTAISLDNIWSALRFRPIKKVGK